MATVLTELNVGSGGTVFNVAGTGEQFVGINTATPQFRLDVRSPVSTGVTALYVYGDARITGDLNLDDITIDDAEIQNLTVTEALNVSNSGLSTFSGRADFNDSVDIEENLVVSGIATFLDNVVAATNGKSVVCKDLSVTSNLSVSGLSTLTGRADFNDSVDIEDNLIVGGIATVTGATTLTGAATLSSTLGVTGSTTLSDNIIVAGLSTFSGITTFSKRVGVTSDIVVDGNTTLSGLSTFTSRADFNDSVDIEDNLIVGGIGTITGAATLSSTLGVTGGTTLSNLTVSGLSTFTGRADFNDSVDIEDNLIVAGIATLSSTVTVTAGTSLSNVTVSGLSTFTGAIDANGNLDVDGETELDNLNVAGLSTFANRADFNDSVDVAANLIVAGIATVTGAATLSSTLGVTGGTTLSNATVTGLSTFTGAIDANGNLDVDGETELDNLNVAGVGTFASTLGVTGGTTLSNVTVSGLSTFTGLADFNGDITASSAKVEDLTNNRVVVVGTGGELEDSANLTFDGTTLTANAFSGDGSALTGLAVTAIISSNSLVVTGVSTLGSVKIFSGIVTATSGVVTYFGDGSNLTGIDPDTLAGVAATGYLRADVADSKTSGDLTFNDNVKASFGTGGDLDIFFGGTDGKITNRTGHLNITSTEDDKDVVISSDDGSGGTANYFRADGSTGEAKLFHYGSEKLNTASDGVEVTGTLTVTDISASGNVTIGGTLTYEDVTNVDSVGVVTARSGVNVTGGNLTVGAAFTVSSAGIVTATSYFGDGSNLSGVGGGVPSGAILMWSGNISAIPTGYVLCDGSNSTPDLRNRFVIGADADDTVDSVTQKSTSVTGAATTTGGSKDSSTVSHSHTINNTLILVLYLVMLVLPVIL